MICQNEIHLLIFTSNSFSGTVLNKTVASRVGLGDGVRRTVYV
jgi:hypothetical protein